jgi:DNA modification methylase
MNDRATAQTRDLIAEFNGVLGTEWTPPASLRGRLADLLHSIRGIEPADGTARRRNLITLANWKFRFNGEGISEFLDRCAEAGIFFNYHDKARIQRAFDCADDALLRACARQKQFEQHLPLLESLFRPISKTETLRRLAAELSNPDNRDSILASLFGGYVFHAFGTRELHEYFNNDCRVAYHEDFLAHLRQFNPETTARRCAMVALAVNTALANNAATEDELRDRVFTAIEHAHGRLANYCYFAVLIRALPPRSVQPCPQWDLCADIVLYAEKFREVNLRTGYFHPQKVRQATLDHVAGLDATKADFEKANEGFYFKDCFVLTPDDSADAESFQPSDLLLLFEKNERDETLIPCPACRSKEVRGNSYPVLGVRSWECQNPLCPERSKYDRGNRYSLQSLLRQEAIEAPENRIPTASLRRWKRDIVACVTDDELLEMLARHYTFHGDTILLLNWSHSLKTCHGRKIISEELAMDRVQTGHSAAFFNSAFFHRFRLPRRAKISGQRLQSLSDDLKLLVYHGDAFETLAALPVNSVDGAVTSPPYYNAKSYASWPNIYCYLHDMYNVARQVHRVLKKGAPFLFNIFDYFDNENSIVFSAMGKKRMILGAYTVHLFRHAGFTLLGNCVWDKGEIEGKRNFNQGNHSPYYQAPFNCWEHIFIFIKGEPADARPYPTILRARPVFKMFNGENTLGHSAPFPKEIPDLLLGRLDRAATVLDPFSGSMTTGRAAYAKGVRSISIDCHREYCDLGLRLLDEESRQLSMFQTLALAESDEASRATAAGR